MDNTISSELTLAWAAAGYWFRRWAKDTDVPAFIYDETYRQFPKMRDMSYPSCDCGVVENKENEANIKHCEE